MLEMHVTNLEQSRKLYELGFKKPSLYKRQIINDMKPILVESNRNYTISGEVTHYYPAYLLSEIMEALKESIPGYKSVFIGYTDERYIYLQAHGIEKTIIRDGLVEAACDLLIWCIENGFISTK